MKKELIEYGTDQSFLADFYRTSQSTIPEIIVNKFFKNVFEAQGIANSTEEKLMAWEAYQKRNEIKKPLIDFLYFAIIVFAAGVLFPVLYVFFPGLGHNFPPKLARWFILSPFSFYFILSFYLLVKVFG